MDILGTTSKKQSKTRKKHHHRILHIRIGLGYKFQLKETIFEIKFAIKKIPPFNDWKSENQQ